MIRFLFSRTFLIHASIALVVALLSFVGAYYFLQNYANAGEAIKVPDLNGMDLVETKAVLSSIDLEMEVVDSVYMAGKKGGFVVSHEPIAGSRVKAGRKIFFTVTRYAAPMIKLPNVLDQSLPLAIAKLKSYGFRVNEVIPRPSDCTECVIAVEYKGTPREPGARMTKGSSVDLIVGRSDNSEPLAVPALIGLTRQDALLVLQTYAFALGATPCDNCLTAEDSAAARIYRQHPEPETMIPMGSLVDIFLTMDPNKIQRIQVDSSAAPNE